MQNAAHRGPIDGLWACLPERSGRGGNNPLNRALLDLHRVQKMPEFWEAARRLLHAALPSIDFVCLCVRPFAITPATVFCERAPFTSDTEFRRFQAMNPMQSYLATHAGATIVRMSDVVAGRALVRSEFYREFMRPKEDRYIAYLNFWNTDLFQGQIGLHRRRGGEDFSAAEVALLEELYPHLDAMLRRIVHLDAERAARLSLENLVAILPVATMLLDWELKLVAGNGRASELCAYWNLEGEGAAPDNAGDSISLPPGVVAYCQSFKGVWNPRRGREYPLGGANGVYVSHPHQAKLRASIKILQHDAAPLSMPMFLVRIEDDCRPLAVSPSSLEAIARLSVREREVALLVSEGCSNEEVARQLGKSVLTVKKQLRSIYQKLNVSNRGRLTARLHEDRSPREQSNPPLRSHLA